MTRTIPHDRRTTTTTEEHHMTITATFTNTLADLDTFEPAKVTHHDDPITLIRTPDFIEDGVRYWIGEDATVSMAYDGGPVHFDDAYDGDDEALYSFEQMGFLARSGVMPDERGITVETHDPEFIDRSALAHSQCSNEWSAWLTAYWTLTVTC